MRAEPAQGLSTPQPGAPASNLALFSPLDAQTLARPFAAQLPLDMQDQRGHGARYFVQHPADALRVPPALPATATALAPLPAHNEVHDQFYTQMYLMSHQYLATRGLLSLVRLYAKSSKGPSVRAQAVL